MAYVQRKFPPSGVTVTEVGNTPATACEPTTATAAAAANKRAIQVRRIIRSTLRVEATPWAWVAAE
jgi:hypothetical protein